MMAKAISYVFRITIVLYVLLSGFYFLRKPGGGGDEALFIADLGLIKSEGWWVAIEKGISIPYMLLSYPLTSFLEPHIALRTVNLILFGALLYYFFKRVGILKLDFYGLLLFFFCTVGYFMAGTNDTVFVVSLVIFIVETHRVLTREDSMSLAWWGVGLVLAFLTRKLLFVYLPVILLALFFLWRFKKVRIKTLFFPTLLLLFGLGLNVPSLNSGNGLSYDQKLPPEGIQATWPQRQYLAQLWVNQGKLSNYNHPNWKQTDAYLKKNGPESLPIGVLDGMLYDPKLTVKEFFKDLFFSLTYGVRQLGLVLPTLLVMALLGLYRIRILASHNFVPWSLLIMIGVFSLIIISFVELRWLAPVFIASIFYFYTLSEHRKISRVLVLANYAVVILLSWYGMYGLIGKL